MNSPMSRKCRYTEANRTYATLSSDRFEPGDADRALFARLEQSRDELRPLEPFARAVLLHHHVRNLVDSLVTGEALRALEAFAPAPDHFAFFTLA